MIFWVYYIFGGEIFYVSFERLFRFYTPPHILRAFRTAIKRIDDLVFGFFANRLRLRTGKLYLSHLNLLLAFVEMTTRGSAEGPLPWHKPPTSRLDTSTRFHLFLSKFQRQFGLHALPSTLWLCNWQCYYFPEP